jgi:hypothetical protein
MIGISKIVAVGVLGIIPAINCLAAIIPLSRESTVYARGQQMRPPFNSAEQTFTDTSFGAFSASASAYAYARQTSSFSSSQIMVSADASGPFGFFSGNA